MLLDLLRFFVETPHAAGDQTDTRGVLVTARRRALPYFWVMA
jgi:hypothetical protein